MLLRVRVFVRRVGRYPVGVEAVERRARRRLGRGPGRRVTGAVILRRRRIRRPDGIGVPGVGDFPVLGTSCDVQANLVARIDFLPGDERVRLYVDPAGPYPQTGEVLDMTCLLYTSPSPRD